MEPRTVALGKMNQIAVVADQDIWESAAGDTFKYYFESAYPIMPQPEPIFDVRHFTVNDLDAEPLRKELRTYAVLADLSDDDSPTTQMVKRDLGTERFNEAKANKKSGNSVGKDKWAKDQLVIYLYANDNPSLATSIKNSFAAVANRIQSHDSNMLKSSVYAVEQVNLGLSDKIEKTYGLDIQIPGLYQEAFHSDEDNFTWLRKDEHDINLSMMFYKMPYADPSQASLESLIKLRNRLSKKYVTTETAGSYMQVNDDDLPVYEYSTKIDGFYTKEIRGVWEMNKDFLGGPFVTYAIVKDQDKEIIFVDVFVYAPSKEKKKYIQQLDYIVKSAKVHGTKAS